MNSPISKDAKITREPLSGSKKIYIEQDGIRVPMREITLSDRW